MAHHMPRNEHRPTTITLAGIQVRRELVAWLADNADEPVSTRLRLALERETRLLGLESRCARRSSARRCAPVRATLQRFPADVSGRATRSLPPARGAAIPHQFSESL